MNILKSVFACCLACAALSFADEELEGNVCDTLSLDGTTTVNLKLAYIDEFLWYGDKDLVTADSQKVIHHKILDDVVPERKKFLYNIPYSVEAGCLVKTQRTFSFAQWDGKKWVLNEDNHDYATTILDIHGNKMSSFDSTNTYNLLLVRAHNGSLDDGSFGPDELFASKSYEFAFESWFATIVTREEKTVEIDGDEYLAYSYTLQYAMATDSLKAVDLAKENIAIPEGNTKVTIQVFHSVMMDESKIVSDDSSEEDAPLMISPLQTAPAISDVRQIRRLDGSVVKSNETVKQGIYYVQGADGMWKKTLIRNR